MPRTRSSRPRHRRHPDRCVVTTASASICGQPKLDMVQTGTVSGSVFRDGLSRLTWSRPDIVDVFTLQRDGEIVQLSPVRSGSTSCPRTGRSESSRSLPTARDPARTSMHDETSEKTTKTPRAHPRGHRTTRTRGSRSSRAAARRSTKTPSVPSRSLAGAGLWRGPIDDDDHGRRPERPDDESRSLFHRPRAPRGRAGGMSLRLLRVRVRAGASCRAYFASSSRGCSPPCAVR